MRRCLLVIGFVASVLTLSAQEVLLPLCHQPQGQKKSQSLIWLPFFDDFSEVALSTELWDFGGAHVNRGYAPLPPTVGMVTLDAFDADGRLYPSAANQYFGGDTLTSGPIRMDSINDPFPRELTVGDSVFLTFFWLPGGGYGEVWEGIGDAPEEGDSLILEFLAPGDSVWHNVWSTSGRLADSLFARTGSYWQYARLAVDDASYFQKGFRFRFRNYCSLSAIAKRGFLSNADQWNIDYVRLQVGRNGKDSVSRDIAFVNPAPSLLKNYLAMPAKQYRVSEMRDSLELTITNLYNEELASSYNYYILDEDGAECHSYNGGYENVPVYWSGLQYQTSTAHARPALAYAFPEGMVGPVSYTAVHCIREGVRGDAYSQNDTIRFLQVFDNYYAYDDGTPENGYGLTSTGSRVYLANRFRLNEEDTLTALCLYFNRTLNDENEEIRFRITVWDDAEGNPGNILYQDEVNRHPKFQGFNKYVRYDLEQPVLCGGTVYIGLEQLSNDFINLGFDRNNDASEHIFYKTDTVWKTSILRGALMLRPYFGRLESLSLDNHTGNHNFRIYSEDRRIVIDSFQSGCVVVYDVLGRVVYRSCERGGNGTVVTGMLPKGIYLVRVGGLAAKKVAVL